MESYRTATPAFAGLAGLPCIIVQVLAFMSCRTQQNLRGAPAVPSQQPFSWSATTEKTQKNNGNAAVSKTGAARRGQAAAGTRDA